MVQIFIDGPNELVHINEIDSVQNLRKAIASRSGIKEVDQRLVFRGKELQDGKLVSDYGVTESSTVSLLLRVHGGSTLGKKVKGRSKEVKKKKEKTGVKQTDEERALQERIRRMHENDYLKRLAINAKNELKNRMLQEQKNSKMNRLKIQNQWRKIMRLAKVESLRKDIEILSQNHERDVDRKDAIIQMLDRDLEEAEEQFQMALRSHLQNVDRLIDLQDARLLALENEFEQDLGTLEDEFNAEREEIIKQHTLEKTELLDIMAAVEVEEHEREAESKQEHEQQREEIRNKNLEDINVLRITLDSTIEDLESHFEAAHVNYLSNTDQRTTEFKDLTRVDQELSKDIDVKIRQIERLGASLAHWRTKITQNVRECAERNQALLEEKDSISAHFQELKGRMNKFREAQARRLSELTQNAHRCKAELKRKCELAERILIRAELCRKMETEREKVLPFYESSVEGDIDGEKDEDELSKGAAPGTLGAAASSDQASAAYQSSALTPSGKVVEEWNALDNFWKRHNKVLLDKLAIEKEKARLEKENTDLQAILKQYLDGISVNEDVMSGLNPLLVVNGRVKLNQPLPVRRGKPAVVDANHMVGTSRVS